MNAGHGKVNIITGLWNIKCESIKIIMTAHCVLNINALKLLLLIIIYFIYYLSEWINGLYVYIFYM